MNDAAARRLVALLAGVDKSIGAAFIQYLALFRPGKTVLRWSRAYTLAEDLILMVKAGRITRNGLTYVVPREAWIEGMEYLADRPEGLRLPLKSHGYLLGVIANKAEKIAATGERKKEEDRQARSDADDSGDLEPIGSNYEDLLERSRQEGDRKLHERTHRE